MDEDQQEEDDKRLKPRPVVFLLLDGFGIAQNNETNAISNAKMPTMAKLIKNYPVATLRSSGGDVNTRYLSIGSGRDVMDEGYKVEESLSAIISNKGLNQLKISETIRFAALTNFFNGHQEKELTGEKWSIISSSEDDKDAYLVYKKIFKELLIELEKNDSYDFIAVSVPSIDLSVLNDDIELTKKLISDIDKEIAKLVSKIIDKNACLIISSAFGNAERMFNLGTETKDLKMTDNPVPFIIVSSFYEGKTIGLADTVDGDLSLLAPAGSLADVAPTILSILGEEKGRFMTGESLL